MLIIKNIKNVAFRVSVFTFEGERSTGSKPRFRLRLLHIKPNRNPTGVRIDNVISDKLINLK